MTTNAETTSLTTPQSSWKEIFSGNVRLVAAVVAVVILATLAYTLISTRGQGRREKAQTAHNQAQKLIQSEMPKIKKPAPAAAADPSGKAAPPAMIEMPDENAKFDVDSTLPASVKALTALTSEFADTRAGFDAALTLGDLYQRHGDMTKAISWYSRAGEIAPDSLGRALSYSAQGYAFEEAGKYQDALQSFTRVSNSGEAALKGDALLAMARSHTKLGDLKQATSIYDQIISQMPGTETAKAAETLKSQLGTPQ